MFVIFLSIDTIKLSISPVPSATRTVHYLHLNNKDVLKLGSKYSLRSIYLVYVSLNI